MLPNEIFEFLGLRDVILRFLALVLSSSKRITKVRLLF